MDTTLMEYTAEDLIAHKLQRAGILISKPKFDQEGADLLAFVGIEDGARFCRIQCKGRSLINSPNSSVKIPKKYVTSSFIVFLFIEDGNADDTHLFSFFEDDIKKWNLNNNEYILNLTKSTFQDNLNSYIFTDSMIKRIVNIVNQSDFKTEFNIMMPQILPTAKMTNNNVIYSDSIREVRVKMNSVGVFDTEIIDKSSGGSRVGSSCPGNPDHYDFNPITDSWTAKFTNL